MLSSGSRISDSAVMVPQLQLPREVIYQLASDDGEQTYFYQQEVEVGLHCAGKPQWQPLDIDLNGQDWLVNIADLLGKNWQEHDLASQPLAELLANYRFLDEQGHALAVGVPSSDARMLDVAENPTSDFVTSNHQLRINGHVDRIEQLHAAGEPITIEWGHRFPEVPGYDDTLYQPVEELQ